MLGQAGHNRMPDCQTTMDVLSVVRCVIGDRVQQRQKICVAVRHWPEGRARREGAALSEATAVPASTCRYRSKPGHR